MFLYSDIIKKFIQGAALESGHKKFLWSLYSELHHCVQKVLLSPFNFFMASGILVPLCHNMNLSCRGDGSLFKFL